MAHWKSKHTSTDTLALPLSRPAGTVAAVAGTKEHASTVGKENCRNIYEPVRPGCVLEIG